MAAALMLMSQPAAPRDSANSSDSVRLTQVFAQTDHTPDFYSPIPGLKAVRPAPPLGAVLETVTEYLSDRPWKWLAVGGCLHDTSHPLKRTVAGLIAGFWGYLPRRRPGIQEEQHGAERTPLPSLLARLPPYAVLDLSGVPSTADLLVRGRSVSILMDG